MILPARNDTLLSLKYYPESNISPVFDQEGAKWCQSAIRKLHWIIKIGKTDISANIQEPKSTQKKKSNSIVYPAVCEGVLGTGLRMKMYRTS
jgi:hypothetical protein